MRPDLKISEYVNLVKEKIAWRRAKQIIGEELELHIADRCLTIVEDWEDVSEATDCAIAELGAPEEVAAILNKSYKPRRHWVMLAVIAMLFVSGIIMRFNVSLSLGVEIRLGEYVSIFWAVVAFVGAYCFNITTLKRYPKAIFGGYIGISAVILLCSTTINGNRVLSIFGDKLSIDLLSLLFPVAFVALLFTFRKSRYIGILLCGAGYGAAMLLMSLVPSVSGVLLVLISSIVMVCVAIALNWFNVQRRKGVLLVGGIAVASLGIFAFYAMTDPYLSRRLELLINPSVDTYGAGRQAISIRALIEASRFLGHGDTPVGYPTAHGFIEKFNGEYMITYYIHNIGLFSFIIMMLILIAFFTLAIVLCVRHKSFIGKMTILAVILSFGVQAAFYIANNFGFSAMSSMALPLISKDETALVINMFLMGIMMSAMRHERLLIDIEKTQNGQSPLLCYNEDGKQIVNPERV